MSRSDSTKRRHRVVEHNPKPVCRESGGKIIHRDRKRALGALNNVRRMPPSSGRLPVDVYRCRHCSGWHLTSQEARHGSR